MKINKVYYEISKKILVLIALFSIGALIVLSFESNKKQILYKYNLVSGDNTETQTNYLAQQSFYTLDDIQPVDNDPTNDQSTELVYQNDTNGEVLAAGCVPFSDTGCESRTVAFQPVCVQGSAVVNMNGGVATDGGDSVRITKNAKIEVWKITSPLAILSGIESTKDNTFAISKSDPAFRSSSDMIDEEYVARAYMAPGAESDQIDNIASGTDDDKFSVHTSAAIGGGSSAAAWPNEATVEKELGSACEDYQPSQPSPEKTNLFGGVLVDAYGTPVDPIYQRNYIDHEPACIFIDPNDIDLPKSDVFETCLNTRSAFDGIVRGVWGIAKRLQCLADPAQCEKVELFGIIIDAPFGKNSQCEEGSCSDQYFDYSVGSNLAPDEVNEYKDEPFQDDFEPVLKAHYVTTPCKVRVDYGTVYKVPCLWDISPYWNQYQLEKQQHEPNDPNFPTFEEYWRLVEDASERRGAVCS